MLQNEHVGPGQLWCRMNMWGPCQQRQNPRRCRRGPSCPRPQQRPMPLGTRGLGWRVPSLPETGHLAGPEVGACGRRGGGQRKGRCQALAAILHSRPRAQEESGGKSIITSAQIPGLLCVCFYFTFLVTQAGINLHSIQTIPAFI